MSADIYADVKALVGQGVDVYLVDPPWKFSSNSAAKPGRNAMRHYPTMSLAEIEAIPIKPTLAENAALFLWCPPAFIAIGAHIPIMKAWGFKPSTVAFTWVKLNASTPWNQKIRDADIRVGTGLTTRKQAEQVLLGTRGKSLRVDGGVPEVILAPIRIHSQKPDEAIQRIERYVGPGRKMVELFSRTNRDGWISLGDEAGRFG